jgi:hypothetical protein
MEFGIRCEAPPQEMRAMHGNKLAALTIIRKRDQGRDRADARLASIDMGPVNPFGGR